jgi:hypothetical protein
LHPGIPRKGIAISNATAWRIDSKMLAMTAKISSNAAAGRGR